jgi:hypothetical protein
MSGLNTEEIIRMAREAGFLPDMFGLGIWDSKEFNVFAVLVATAEREACAKACDELANEAENSWQYRMGANWSAIRIRARGTDAT